MIQDLNRKLSLFGIFCQIYVTVEKIIYDTIFPLRNKMEENDIKSCFNYFYEIDETTIFNRGGTMKITGVAMSKATEKLLEFGWKQVPELGDVKKWVKCRNDLFHNGFVKFNDEHVNTNIEKMYDWYFNKFNGKDELLINIYKFYINE
ncbi:MAG: hypothetical protein LBV48_01475 [Mycoplasmataceae bacterium]|nr:hypothetical protein [Mycoplasmataceae bacterium]